MRPADRVGTATLQAIFPGVGSFDHGGSHHGLDLRDHQRADPDRSACVLRHGATETFLRFRRKVERGAGARFISVVARIVGRLPGVAAHL